MRTILLAVNVVGGIAVLGSYAWGFVAHPDVVAGLWGDMPSWAIPGYTGSMPFAAAGWLTTLAFLGGRADPSTVSVLGRYGYGWFVVSMALVLTASSAWMPLCVAALETGETAWLPLIQFDLALTALGSLAILGGLATMAPRTPRSWWLGSVGGMVAFCWQTVVLDALVWPRFFGV